jgi:hypothetical protein
VPLSSGADKQVFSRRKISAASTRLLAGRPVNGLAKEAIASPETQQPECLFMTNMQGSRAD